MLALVYTDSKKTASCLLPRHTIFSPSGWQIKMSICTHTGRFISVPLCSGQSVLASICLFVQFRPRLHGTDPRLGPDRPCVHTGPPGKGTMWSTYTVQCGST